MGPDPAELEDLYSTPHGCASCEDQLFLTDELVLVQVVYTNALPDRIECYDIDNGEGGFTYEPYFVHLDCWENFMEELDELTEHTPPTPDLLSIYDCSQCKSGIRAWETSCLVTPGELRRSPRAPEGVQGIHFDNCLGEPQLICISCITRMNDEVFEMWEDFSHNGECSEGSHIRCWRGNACHDNGCPCPKEQAC
ncbi:unnamed protein product [marine sediment metagenome]|uniref:Uncharacterized protein n=1 Tax=marine sediment metagenome TaxID=412755 RepID=X0U584_9ZZZZ